MSHSNYNFQLIVNIYLNPNCEGACTDVASAIICNESFKLIDVLCSVGDFSVPANFGNKDSEGARAPSTTFPMLHDRKSKFIVAPQYSKTFLHFGKGFTIFCEGDQENAYNGKDDEVIIWQKSNLAFLLSLASAISTQAALDASALYNTLAETASFGQIIGSSASWASLACLPCQPQWPCWLVN
jgi:hypothetical protein